MISLIPDVTNKLITHHFNTQLHTNQGEFFEFLRHMNFRSMVVILENMEQFQKTQDEYKLWKEKSSIENFNMK